MSRRRLNTWRYGQRVSAIEKPKQVGPTISSLDELPFRNWYVRALPGDSELANSRRQVHEAAYSLVNPTTVAEPALVLWSPEVFQLLGFNPALAADDDFAQVFSGNRVPVGAVPFAQNYGGHQFGNWAGQLGDGRAIALGEIVGVDSKNHMVQLKGAGATPYSRGGDGRAVLRSSLREFLCSEAMYHLGIPTSRALSLVLTGDQVVRDIMYDGHPAAEPGAVVARVAPSFTRFGTFELPASRGDVALLEKLVRYSINTEFPELASLNSKLGFQTQVVAFFEEIAKRTVSLVVDWMRVGFVHGVLNTDNMSILGLTIDYGPYGWLESFDLNWTPNTTDAGARRYRYGAQPEIAHWNLAALANALVPLVEEVAPLQQVIDEYPRWFSEASAEMMVKRLGWGAKQPGDEVLFEELFKMLSAIEVDQVIFYRELARVPLDAHNEHSDDEVLAPLMEAFYQPEMLVGETKQLVVSTLRTWIRRVAQGGLDDATRIAQMDSVNPKYVLRNYLAQEAIEAAETGDWSLAEELFEVLRTPYVSQPDKDRFARKRPEWARNKVGSSMLSCSS